ncbi:heme exporter protein CcmD [Rouxiella badensis]|uniref:heme exporter protein CcmD n=1 Tax=Rouxiella badensis TaxID=1646377 RepID=UPI00037635FB|nr:heme exporter protein CcmD [Rouxiella badensis]MCC3721198.1 heme exporter protein CcmD [Rouxiella badensis]MCC3730907.1 heme exporter protein CcmD [Rouxiella badensis]MCC3734580.1 heme exporter protein CcmD [Rouxiella badensis]MCC3742435.1 heme exporter protein CcmD [Rouxiella badensis]MCC3760053.1 heme exporter protein CcmD [Rouxiella badensis]
MNAAFPTWQAFFAMGGYAFYVWLSVIVTLVSLFGIIIHTVWHRRQLLAEIRRRQSREQRIRQSKKQASAAHNNSKREAPGSPDSTREKLS